jgi:hypothetical protein
MAEHEHTEAFWLAYLAASIRTAIRHPEIARSHLRDALNHFTKSGVCSDNLRAMLKTKGD